MSDIASNDLALEHTPRGSPSPPHNQDIPPETTESYTPAATETYAEQDVNDHEEPAYEPEAPATPVPPPLIVEEEDDLAVPVEPGTQCRRNGCKAEFVDQEKSRAGDGEDAVCTYHPSPVSY